MDSGIMPDGSTSTLETRATKFIPTTINADMIKYSTGTLIVEGAHTNSKKTIIDVEHNVIYKPGKEIFRVDLKTSKKDGGSESTIIKTHHVNSENYLGDAEVRAGESVNLGGADFLKSEDSTENKLRISAKDVKNTVYKNTGTERTQQLSESTDGTDVSINPSNTSSSLMRVIEKKMALDKKSKEGQTLNAGMVAAESVGDATQLLFSSLIESNIKLFSVTTTEKTSKRHDEEEIRSKIDSDIIKINASNKIALKGVDIGNEKADVTLKGDKGVTISGTQHKTHERSTEKNTKGSIEAGFGADIGGVGLGLNINVNIEDSLLTDRNVKNTLANIRARNLRIKTEKGDVVMDHTRAKSKNQFLNVGGNVKSITRQDTQSSESEKETTTVSAGISVTPIGLILPTGSVGHSEAESKSGSRTMNERAGFESEVADDYISGDVDNLGAVFYSDKGSSRVEGDVKNQSLIDTEYKNGSRTGGNFGLSYSGLPTIGITHSVDDEVDREVKVKSIINTKTLVYNGKVKGEHVSNEAASQEVIKDKKVAGVNIEVTLALMDPRSKKTKTGDKKGVRPRTHHTSNRPKGDTPHKKATPLDHAGQPSLITKHDARGDKPLRQAKRPPPNKRASTKESPDLKEALLQLDALRNAAIPPKKGGAQRSRHVG
ncbi:MAG: hemagglutinin repeat-containing protein [Candidatus Thiodiazotropha sp. (ex Lucinoma aequizonata)]|nr:hemagglutinin repeat-containing protein [Candidatus Thiodiazotropha sp. (ex Lucinoma aequizonata)]